MGLKVVNIHQPWFYILAYFKGGILFQRIYPIIFLINSIDQQYIGFLYGSKPDFIAVIPMFAVWLMTIFYGC